MLDASTPLAADDDELLSTTITSRRVVVRNKSDLAPAWDPRLVATPVMPVSARTGAGFDRLRAAMVAELSGGERLRDTPRSPTCGTSSCSSRARAALGRAAAAAGSGTPEEFVAADVSEARGYLEEVTGARTPDDVLHAIFDRFCIGK